MTTTIDVLEALHPALAKLTQNHFERRDLCILATRVALDVCNYFGVEAREQPVKLLAYNRAMVKKIEEEGIEHVTDKPLPPDCFCVGIGYGTPEGIEPAYDGHLITLGPDCFADFAIQQAERLERGIYTGCSVIGPHSGQHHWMLENETGTVLDYRLMENVHYLRSPDWLDKERRHKIVGALIRHVRAQLRAKAAVFN